ncbi:MAG: signal peptidase I [Parcubacteria group bacterium]|nr:signal peptidase I [Parcubacteria group bacterium]
MKIFFWETVEVILISAAIILPIRYFLVQPFFVKGQSMEPTFEDGDYLIIDEISFRFREPERGEVVVFRFPKEPSQFYIKRVIGLPGETVEIKDGKVRIYPAGGGPTLVLEESYLAPGERTGGEQRMFIDAGSYFVLGDNRDASYDSRRWGLVSRSNTIGRVWLRPWPFTNARVFAAPIY